VDTLTIVELLDRRGRVRERHHVSELPFRIGRAYENDLILDDPTVGPNHAVLERNDGALSLTDLDSVNGLVHERAKRERIPVGEDTTVRLGRSVLRFRSPAFVVPPALPVEVQGGGLLSSLGHWGTVPAAIAVALFTTYMGSVRENYIPFTWAPVLTDLLTTGVVLAGWAGLWALLTRVLTPRGRFLAHLAIAAIWFLCDTLLDAATEYARFFVGSIAGVEVGSALVALAFGALLFYGHISLTRALSGWARRSLCLVLSLILVGVLQLESALFAVDWTYTLPYWSRLQPVATRWLPTEDRATFFDAAGRIEGELETLAAERLAELDAR
jgi:hypothetical protein